MVAKCLLLGEEIGELFKSIREAAKLKTDIITISEKVADIVIYLCSIANRINISIEQMFSDKEEINKKRIWK